VIPRSIVYSVLAVAGIYSLMNLSIIGVIPWREAVQSKFIAAQFIEKLYGTKAAAAVTVLVLWTAFASVFALLLGYSRIPYAAAVNGHFFPVFGRLHPTGKFPHVSLLVMGLLSIGASFWNLETVISALLTSRILVSSLDRFLRCVTCETTGRISFGPFACGYTPSQHRRTPWVGLCLRDVRLGIHGVRPANAYGWRGGLFPLEAGFAGATTIMKKMRTRRVNAIF
jgi:hypothetical protein